MTVFRWIIGVLGGFFALGAIFGFGLFIAFDSQLWLQRARRFRHYIWVLLPVLVQRRGLGPRRLDDLALEQE